MVRRYVFVLFFVLLTMTLFNINLAFAASITLNNPYNGANFTIGDTVSLSASATGVDYVKFYVGSENPGAKVYGKGTYTASWSASEAGSYKVTAVGYKNGSEVTRTST
ncbi:MAG: Ig-like domain-containing protein, partial [Bacillota bacterium]